VVDSADTAFGRQVIAKVAWRLVPFLGLLYFFAFLDRVNVGFAALTMNADIGLSATAYGIGAGIFFIGYVLFEVPSNLLLEKFGPRIWIARIMITWGLCSGAMAFVHGATGFYIVRVLLGFAEAGFFPGIIYYLGCWFPAQHRARIIALFLLALPLSSVIGAPISTSLLSVNWYGIAGWRWMFALEALPTIVLGVVVLRWLTDRPAQATWLAPDEKAWLVAACDSGPHTSHGDALRTVLAAPRAWLQGLVYFGLVVGVYGFGFWLPQLLATFGKRTPFEVGLLTMIPYAATCVAMVIWGRHSDATGERTWHVIVPALLGAVALQASSMLLGSPALALASLTFAAIGLYSGLSSFWAQAAPGLRGAAAAGTIALVNSLGNLGGFLGPALIGMAKERTGGYAASLMLVSAFLVLAAAGMLAVRALDARATSRQRRA